jgi:hypothetical protein
MLSQGRMSAPQVGQREGGETTERPRGRRWMQTLAKLPTIRPRARAAPSNRGVLRASCRPKLGSMYTPGAIFPRSARVSQGCLPTA